MDRKAMVVERVYRKNIRPQPPQAKKGEGGIVGDMVEVFDTKCWKVVKVAKNNRVNIRFLGSIQSKEFDECNLRIRQAWDQNKWSMTEKVQKKNKIRYRSSDSKGQLEASCEEPYSKESKISCKRRKSNIYVGGPSMVNRWLYIQWLVVVSTSFRTVKMRVQRNLEKMLVIFPRQSHHFHLCLGKNSQRHY
ncbi:uncharacterized protein LOC126784544 isoform X2 [Argentina anserina]|uniref:uncharacterized protein LOC126784544 isoform X2 n=1 Tax=Argentina anserina TaxID=57926 RepID=UPI00217622C5|nr:uncharacterized protein LOC126784544 isoform X2 [Potentilla anserina]